MGVPEAAVTLAHILDQFRDDARNNRDLGDRFERLLIQFFKLDPIFAEGFSDLWLWNEWPGKGNVGDVGIDLVAQERATASSAPSSASSTCRSTRCRRKTSTPSSRRWAASRSRAGSSFRRDRAF